VLPLEVELLAEVEAAWVTVVWVEVPPAPLDVPPVAAPVPAPPAEGELLPLPPHPAEAAATPTAMLAIARTRRRSAPVAARFVKFWLI
jgi:hypothetical protein